MAVRLRGTSIMRSRSKCFINRDNIFEICGIIAYVSWMRKNSCKSCQLENFLLEAISFN